MSDSDYEGITCNISDEEAESLANAFMVKYENKFDSCKFISSVLRLPNGTILTDIIAHGAFGIVINAKTKSGNSYIAKLALIDDVKTSEIKIGGKNSFTWASVPTKDFKEEIKIQEIIYDLYKNENLMGDIKGAIIPAIKTNYIVKIGSRKFGVILMEKVKGVTLGEMMLNATPSTFGRVLKLFKKYASIIGRFHDEGVIHGDSHVWNVMVIDGTDDLAILDFGQSVLFERRLGNYFLTRDDKRFQIYGGTFYETNCQYDMIQAMVFFLLAPDSYFSKRLNGGKDILREMNDLFNPQSTKIISTRTSKSLIEWNNTYEIISFERIYSFERVELLPRELEDIVSRDRIHRQSRSWRAYDLPGGKFFHERYNRDWSPIEDIKRRERNDNKIQRITFRRPPDTKEIILYKI